MNLNVKLLTGLMLLNLLACSGQSSRPPVSQAPVTVAPVTSNSSLPDNPQPIISNSALAQPGQNPPMTIQQDKKHCLWSG